MRARLHGDVQQIMNNLTLFSSAIQPAPSKSLHIRRIDV
jgi:hypothetical protein